MSLRFEFPTKEKENDAIKYIDEFIRYNSAINGTGGLDINDYDAWLKRTIDANNGINIRKDRVPASTYFVYDEDDVLIGMVNIRHKLSEYLVSSGSGHIGYSVRPAQRRKGYATIILEKALYILRNEFQVSEVLLGCYKENIASIKTIVANGGVLDREIIEDNGKSTLAYIIKLKT